MFVWKSLEAEENKRERKRAGEGVAGENNGHADEAERSNIDAHGDQYTAKLSQLLEERELAEEKVASCGGFVIV